MEFLAKLIIAGAVGIAIIVTFSALGYPLALGYFVAFAVGILIGWL